MLNGAIHLPGKFVLISDIGFQPADRSYPGSTLVCVTTNVNTACCRRRENNTLTNATAGAVGEWYYPNGTLVPRPAGLVTDFARVGSRHEVRLARAVLSDSTPPLGVYTCEVPEPSTGILHNASIPILKKGIFDRAKYTININHTEVVLTLCAHAQEGYCSYFVCLSVCLSVYLSVSVSR